MCVFFMKQWNICCCECCEQVEDVDRKFFELDQLKAANWIKHSPVKPKRAKVSAVIRLSAGVLSI